MEFVDLILIPWHVTVTLDVIGHNDEDVSSVVQLKKVLLTYPELRDPDPESPDQSLDPDLDHINV